MDAMPCPPSSSAELVDQPVTASEVPDACLVFDTALARRLAQAKALLDRLEHDSDSRDLSALGAARIEFAQASRAVADDLLSRGLG